MRTDSVILSEPLVEVVPGRELRLRGWVRRRGAVELGESRRVVQPSRVVVEITHETDRSWRWRGVSPITGNEGNAIGAEYEFILEHAWFPEGTFSALLRVLDEENQAITPVVQRNFTIDQSILHWGAACVLDLESMNVTSGFVSLHARLFPAFRLGRREELSVFRVGGRLRPAKDASWQEFSLPVLSDSDPATREAGDTFEIILPFALPQVPSCFLELWIEPTSAFRRMERIGPVTELVFSTEKDGDVELYRAEIRAVSQSAENSLFCRVSGTVKNTGAMVWRNDGPIQRGPYRLAMELRKLDGAAPIREQRIGFSENRVYPGDQAHFEAGLETFGLSAGEYRLEIDVLREELFWFSKRGGTKRHSLPFVHAGTAAVAHQHKINMPNALETLDGARVIVIAPELPRFDRSAGGKRLYSILEVLRGRNCRVDFLYDHLSAPDEELCYRRALDALGVAQIHDVTGALMAMEADSFDIAIACWWEQGERYLPILRRLNGRARLIVDTVDLHWIREERGVKTGELAFHADELKERKRRELDTYRLADTVWVVSEEDRRTLLNELPSISTRIVSIIEKFPVLSRRLAPTSILFVGGFRHPPNINAALWAAEIVRTLGAVLGRSIRLDIVGDSPPEQVRREHDGKQIFVHGHVADLKGFFQSGPILLAPLTYGGGVKGKIVEAIAHGLVVVTTAIGNEGIGLCHEEDGFLCERTQEFVDTLVGIFTGRFDLSLFAARARRKAEQKFDTASAQTSIETSAVCRPVVIAVVTFNARRLLERCIDSLLAQTDYPNFRIAVLSNGCSDGTASYLRRLKASRPDSVDIFLFRFNQFFVLPNNFLIESYPRHDIVLVNNDVEFVCQDWLWGLFDAAHSSSGIAAAGGLILDANGAVAEAGSILDDEGFGRNLGRGVPADSLSVAASAYVGYCSGCLLYLRRDAIDRIGVFDPRYAPMYYEDVDWQFRAHLCGLKTIFTARAKVVHREGSSAGVDVNLGLKQFQEINRKKFLEKFSGVDLCALNS